MLPDSAEPPAEILLQNLFLRRGDFESLVFPSFFPSEKIFLLQILSHINSAELCPVCKRMIAMYFSFYFMFLRKKRKRIGIHFSLAGS